jgi:glycosyltransferase involved in cell wall biosynthesis
MISFVIPVYNVENFIFKCINSILHQTIMDIEILIIDDGSTDNTVAVAQKLLGDSGFSKWRVFRKTNGGVSSARNMGLSMATGDYIVFLDGDDFIADNLVSLISKSAKKDQPDLICWGYDKVNENGIIKNEFFKRYRLALNETNGITMLEEILFNNSFWLWTGNVAYNRIFLTRTNIRYFEGCNNGEDQEFCFKVLMQTSSIEIIHEIGSYYFYRENSITNSYNVSKFCSVMAFQRVANYIDEEMVKNPKADLNRIRKKISKDKVVNTYIENYLSNYEVLVMIKQENPKFARVHLDNDIEILYPGLVRTMNRLIFKFWTLDLKLLLKIKLFQISPSLILWAIKQDRH